MQARLERRINDLEQERHLSPLPPVVVGGVLIVPQGLLNRLKGVTELDQFAHETAVIERIAMQAVMEKEQRLGNQPRDVRRDIGVTSVTYNLSTWLNKGDIPA